VIGADRSVLGRPEPSGRWQRVHWRTLVSHTSRYRASLVTNPRGTSPSSPSRPQLLAREMLVVREPTPLPCRRGERGWLWRPTWRWRRRVRPIRKTRRNRCGGSRSGLRLRHSDAPMRITTAMTTRARGAMFMCLTFRSWLAGNSLRRGVYTRAAQTC
jgi:hypothetical protein